MTLRPIRAMRELVPEAMPDLDLGPSPELRWVDPASLLVDESYQRDLTDRSRRLIKNIVHEFAWRKWKPPIVVDTGDGLHCIDGQHGAIGAVTRGVPLVPVFIVTAGTLQLRADSFVAHNKDRVVMTSFDIFRARLAAGDEEALDVRNVCNRAGVTLKIINPQMPTKIGDCASVGTISGLVKRQGVQKARSILEALVKGGRAPIGAAEIAAVEAVMVMVRPQTSVDEMARVIEALSDHGVMQARMRATNESKPHKHVLFADYMNLLEKQTGVHRVAAG